MQQLFVKWSKTKDKTEIKYIQDSMNFFINGSMEKNTDVFQAIFNSSDYDCTFLNNIAFKRPENQLMIRDYLEHFRIQIEFYGRETSVDEEKRRKLVHLDRILFPVPKKYDRATDRMPTIRIAIGDTWKFIIGNIKLAIKDFFEYISGKRTDIRTLKACNIIPTVKSDTAASADGSTVKSDTAASANGSVVFLGRMLCSGRNSDDGKLGYLPSIDEASTLNYLVEQRKLRGQKNIVIADLTDPKEKFDTSKNIMKVDGKPMLVGIGGFLQELSTLLKLPLFPEQFNSENADTINLKNIVPGTGTFLTDKEGLTIGVVVKDHHGQTYTKFNFPLFDHSGLDVCTGKTTKKLDEYLSIVHKFFGADVLGYINCFSGVERSNAFLTSYLVKYCGFTPIEANEQIRQIRPQAKKLEKLDSTLRGEIGRTFVNELVSNQQRLNEFLQKPSKEIARNLAEFFFLDKEDIIGNNDTAVKNGINIVTVLLEVAEKKLGSDNNKIESFTALLRKYVFEGRKDHKDMNEIRQKIRAEGVAQFKIDGQAQRKPQVDVAVSALKIPLDKLMASAKQQKLPNKEEFTPSELIESMLSFLSVPG